MPCRARTGSGPSPTRPNASRTSPGTLPSFHEVRSMRRGIIRQGVGTKALGNAGRTHEFDSTLLASFTFHPLPDVGIVQQPRFHARRCSSLVAYSLNGL